MTTKIYGGCRLISMRNDERKWMRSWWRVETIANELTLSVEPTLGAARRVVDRRFK